MRINAKTIFLLLAVLTQGTRCLAQQDGWFMELGIGGGGSVYMGDVNDRLYRDTNGAVSIIARYNINPRLAVKANLAAAGISGSTDNANGTFPTSYEVRFSRTVYDFGVQAEWGFTGYGIIDWNGTHRLAPYGLAGLGMSLAPAKEKNDFALCLPIGLGLRYKLSERVNLGMEWTMRFTTSDRLDVNENGDFTLQDPFLIKGKGIKNKDSYSFTMFYLTFDVFKRPCDCNDEKSS